MAGYPAESVSGSTQAKTGGVVQDFAAIEKEAEMADQIVHSRMEMAKVQPDQINMAVFCWYLLKRDLSSIGYCTRVHWTSHFFQGTRKT